MLTAPINWRGPFYAVFFITFFFLSLFPSVSEKKQDESRSWEGIIEHFCRIYDFCFSLNRLQQSGFDFGMTLALFFFFFFSLFATFSFRHLMRELEEKKWNQDCKFLYPWRAGR